MTYELVQSCGDTLAVPQIIFSKLADTEDDWMRVALYMVSTKDTDPVSIARALRLKSADKAREALLFWKGAGLLQASDAPTPEPVNTPQLRTRLTTSQVTNAAQGDASIASLVQESQHILGRIVSQSDTNILVSLYCNDGIPVDMILLGLAHFAALGKGVAYTERVLLNWYRSGIDTGAACERHLQLLALRAEREQQVSVLFGFADAQFTNGERTIIANWFEQFGYDDAMITEAIAHAADKKTVRYVNGILRAWHQKGFKSVRDVMQESASTMQNIQVSNPNAKNVLGGIKRAPVFKQGGTT